jgi:hypothetical protein
MTDKKSGAHVRVPAPEPVRRDELALCEAMLRADVDGDVYVVERTAAPA